MTTILGLLKKRAESSLRIVHTHLLRWTKPATRTPVRGAITDMAMTKAACQETAESAPAMERVRT